METDSDVHFRHKLIITKKVSLTRDENVLRYSYEVPSSAKFVLLLFKKKQTHVNSSSECVLLSDSSLTHMH